MKTKYFIGTAFLLIIGFACSKNAVTGRKQLNLIPSSQMQSMSYTQYSQFLTENKAKVVENSVQATQVKAVGIRIKTAVENYMKQKNMSSKLDGFAWEFNVVDDPTVNAWCMPGGKVVFYTGILPICKDEAGIAVVMGHEVAHAIANHGGERMSQELALQTGLTGLQVALSQKPQQTQQIFMQAVGTGAQIGVMLPFSRLHESEADKMGLIFMAMAGYDPNNAVEFWKRMSAIGGQKPPQILSTHPSDDKRIKDLQAAIPEAMKYYKR
jgi:predicted Zn-dependent protease